MDGPDLEVSGRRMGLSNESNAVRVQSAPPVDRPRWLSFPPMTDRGLPIVDGAPACPFVAFEDDRDGRGQAPDHRHRCFAEPRPAPRALAHQEAYCLSSAFPVCPTFQDWARREAATARAAQLDAEAEAPAIEEPVSQSLPPRELEPRHAPSTDTPPPLPPRRNPPRAWADPPPWAGDTDGEPAEPPSFLAARPPEPSDHRAAEAAAWGAASRGLAGSAADRLAGGYADEADEPVAPSPAAYEAASYAAPVVNDPNERYRPPVKAAARAARIGRRVRPAGNAPIVEAGRSALRPVGSTDRARRRRRRMRGSRRPRPSRRRTPPSCSGRPGRRRDATRPTRRCGPGSACPSFGGISRLGVAAAAVVLAAAGAVLRRPDAAGHRRQQPGRRRRTGGVAARRGADPDADPDREARADAAGLHRRPGRHHAQDREEVRRDDGGAARRQPEDQEPEQDRVGDSINIPVPEPDAGNGGASGG